MSAPQHTFPALIEVVARWLNSSEASRLSAAVLDSERAMKTYHPSPSALMPTAAAEMLLLPCIRRCRGHIVGPARMALRVACQARVQRHLDVIEQLRVIRETSDGAAMLEDEITFPRLMVPSIGIAGEDNHDAVTGSARRRQQLLGVWHSIPSSDPAMAIPPVAMEGQAVLKHAIARKVNSMTDEDCVSLLSDARAGGADAVAVRQWRVAKARACIALACTTRAVEARVWQLSGDSQRRFTAHVRSALEKEVE